MKALIIIHSYHHNNTLKVAKAISEVLKCDVKNTQEAKNIKLEKYDLVGFGAGIDSGMHYKELLVFADNIKNINNKKRCFIFSTSAIQGVSKVAKDHGKLRHILKVKGYNVLGEFSCKGFNTNLFLKYFGGMNKNHPNDIDIANAKQFASTL